MTSVMKNLRHSMTFAFEEWVMVNPQVSLLNLTLDADIPGDVVWSRIDGKHIVSVPYHDGLFVDRVYDFLDEEIDRGTEHVFDARDDNSVKENGRAEVDFMALNDTAHKRWRCTVDASCCANCIQPFRNGGPIYRFWACRSCRPTGAAAHQRE